jgi:hypothetical protein
MNRDLYSIPVSGDLKFRRCGGNDDSNGDQESCVSFARLPNEDVVLVRDTKLPGVELRFTDAEIRAFMNSYTAA